MAVPVNKRGENTLEVWLKAVDLAKLERYWKTLTKELR